MNASSAAGLVVAHGGGAPEAAVVGLPVLVLIVFAVLERRARRRERERQERSGSTDDAGGA